MANVLIVGSINMDIVFTLKDFPVQGETIFGNSVTYIPGGKGANQAVAASRLGAAVSFVGCVGNDMFGKALVDFLKRENIDITHVEMIKESSGTALVMVDSHGENEIVVVSGANAAVSVEKISSFTDVISRSDIVIAQHEIPQGTNVALFTLAKDMGKITVLNPAPARNISDKLFSVVDYLVLNEIELGFFSKQNMTTEKDMLEASKALLKKGVQMVLVTLGAKGVVAIGKEQTIRVEAEKVTAVDTTAAGDCFVGAFATKLASGASIKAAIKFANVAASLSVQRMGASTSIPTIEEVEKRKEVR